MFVCKTKSLPSKKTSRGVFTETFLSYSGKDGDKKENLGVVSPKVRMVSLFVENSLSDY